MAELTNCPASIPTPTTIAIPGILSFWPWSRSINPHYDECKAEAAAWAESFKAFTPERQKRFNLCNFTLLAALAYPLLNKEGYRIASDLMNLFFIIDDHTDLSDNETAKIQADIIMDALRNPHKVRPDDEWVGGKVTRSFWLNAIRTATPVAQKRFIDTFQDYMDSVVQQAIDRNGSLIRDIESFFKVRRDTVGAYSSFVAMEIHMNIPDEVIQHPVIAKLAELATDLMFISNDVISYKVEHDRGDVGHNLVTIVMHQKGMDLQSAMDYVGKMHDDLAVKFLDEWKNIPTFGGPLDREVMTYCDGLANWVHAIHQWSFEGGRYCGENGLEVQRTLQIEIRN